MGTFKTSMYIIVLKLILKFKSILNDTLILMNMSLLISGVGSSLGMIWNDNTILTERIEEYIKYFERPVGTEK